MADSSVIELLIEPAEKDLGEFSVRRALPDKRRQRVGPFIFFDHMGPAEFPPGTGVNVRAHPHIGLSTITYLFEGEILHRDSLGYVQPIRPGEINWMTAGRGIVHSEKVRPEIFESGQKLHGLQTWLALPIEHEEDEPRFEHYGADGIPKISLEGAEVTVVIGSAYGETSPVATASETLYVEVRMQAGASIDLPEAEEIGLYVIDGKVDIDGQTVSSGVLAVLEKNSKAVISSSDGAHVMICGGDALEGDRIIWWNFVSSSRERLEKAKRDWNEGRFDEVPGETDFIPLPTKVKA
jgi:redox-sensitive bicupin YhaK (pirin superfamily)